MEPCLLFVLSLAAAAPAQEPYRLPPPEVVEIVDAPPAPDVRLSPDGRWMLLVESAAMPSIEDLSRPLLRLAGARIDPAANAPHRTSFDRGLVLREVANPDPEHDARVPLPEGARLVSTSWSHGSQLFALVLLTEFGSELWCASVQRPAEPLRLVDGLSTVLGSPFSDGVSWTPDGLRLVCRVVPRERGDAPEPEPVPKGPLVQETASETSPLRTYQDLLESVHDEALFEHYATTELVSVDATNAEVRRLPLPPGMYTEPRYSPDGSALLVTRIERPFSRLMPWSMFPQRIVAYDAEGETLWHVDVPLERNVPIEGVRLGPRSVQWRPGEPKTLAWVEALDGGDPRREAEYRDRWMELRLGEEREPRELLRTEHRARGLAFLQDLAQVVASEYDRDRRWTRATLFDFGPETVRVSVLEDRSVRDRYGDPGRLETQPDGQGFDVVRIDGDWVYRSGSGASPEGLLPFLDRQNVRTRETERLWRCQPGTYESAVRYLGGGRFVTRRESPADPPNYHLVDLAAGEARALTSFTDPTPQIRGVQKKLLVYERADGVPLSGTLYVPAGVEPGTRLPLLVWAYPLEFNDAGTAGQVTTSPWTFTRPSGASHLLLLTQGYAVLDGATMPVIGDPETMNDTFVEQIVAAAQAAIDAAVAEGVADPARVAVAGHSYGAFMTANLLAHCDLFRAGIARSGAYNRTLTPFGFQAERRTLWEAPEVYFAASPFMHAHRIDEPLLLVHGEVDDNSGTFPMQSERLFQAMKGNGGTARLVVLPAESHGYRARESVLHTLAEMIEWLDLHVKSAPVTGGGDSQGR